MAKLENSDIGMRGDVKLQAVRPAAALLFVQSSSAAAAKGLMLSAAVSNVTGGFVCGSDTESELPAADPRSTTECFPIFQLIHDHSSARVKYIDSGNRRAPSYTLLSMTSTEWVDETNLPPIPTPSPAPGVPLSKAPYSPNIYSPGAHLAQGHFGMQMGQTGDRTADLQVGGRPLYPSATAVSNLVSVQHSEKHQAAEHEKSQSVL
ncbi:unnamed protein product [Pleuronectes platessa]|uniref:Uncharacterized protein n=1 Tax=Pleuronectes platessa TaxID=8262 RepID=A0A9N7Z5L2_PLEPL|nr:unnamed protein product [Pleuronectes platessa]